MAKGKGGTANKQERAAKKQKKADKQADVIIEAAVAEVKAKAKRGEVTEDDKALGQQVKDLRDSGMAWWQIAHTLRLPGSADNVREGKSGASKARALYKKAFGALPETARSRAGTRPDRVYGDGPRPAGQRTRNARRDVIRKDPELASMFTDEHSDEDIVKMLTGRRITYTNSLSGVQDTLRIHKESRVEIAHYPNGKCIQFREDHSDSPGIAPAYKYRPAQMRTIRLDAIVKVAS